MNQDARAARNILQHGGEVGKFMRKGAGTGSTVGWGKWVILIRSVKFVNGSKGLASYTGRGEKEMLEANPQARIVLTTESTLDEANKLGRTLVEERLVACATLLPVVQSIYYWKDQIQSAPETMIMLKTSADKLEALEARVRELHSYRVPEFLVIPVEQGSKVYLDWLSGILARHP